MQVYTKANVKCQGFMLKKGGMRWQKRYFVLCQIGKKPARLSYFKDDRSDQDNARATLELAADAKVNLLIGIRPHAFQVILKGLQHHPTEILTAF